MNNIYCTDTDSLFNAWLIWMVIAFLFGTIVGVFISKHETEKKSS